jgi:hypothetical protein
MPKWVEIHFGKNRSEENSSSTKSTDKQGRLLPEVEKEPIWKVPEKVTDQDRYFWEVQVPKSLARLSETPFIDHITTLFPKAGSITFFDENDRYVEKEALINEVANVFLKREGELRFYRQTQGEP